MVVLRLAITPRARPISSATLAQGERPQLPLCVEISGSLAQRDAHAV
jgi:hypothetical protein